MTLPFLCSRKLLFGTFLFRQESTKRSRLKGRYGQMRPLRIPRCSSVTFYKEPSSAFQTTLRQHCLRNDTIILNFPFSMGEVFADAKVKLAIPVKFGFRQVKLSLPQNISPQVKLHHEVTSLSQKTSLARKGKLSSRYRALPRKKSANVPGPE